MTAKLVISDHSQLGGLTTGDPHTQYFYLPGRAGGQTAIGGTLTNQSLTLQDNVADVNQAVFGPGGASTINALFNLGMGSSGNDLESRRVAVGDGTQRVTPIHMLIGQETYTPASGNVHGLGMFTKANPSVSAAHVMYGMIGNNFILGTNWAAGSGCQCLWFIPAVQTASAAGSANMDIIGVNTGGLFNVASSPCTAKDVNCINITPLLTFFGGDNTSVQHWRGIYIFSPVATTGTWAHNVGLEILPQTNGTVDQGIWLHGDGAGSDLCLGAGTGNIADALVYYNGTNLVIDPDNLGSGRVFIGATGDDDMLLNDIEIDGDINHDGSLAGFYGTAPAAKPAALTAALTQITHTGPGTPDYAIATPVDSSVGAAWGFSNQNEFETAMSVILNLQTRLDQLESRLQGIGLLT